MMEALDRGLVALPTSDGVFLSWRLLGTEPADTLFHVYRIADDGLATRLTNRPLCTATCMLDRHARHGVTNAYCVRAVRHGQEAPPSRPAIVEPTIASSVRPYLEIPLHTPAGYAPNDGSVGDLDGDRAYEIVLHQAGRSHDNAHAGQTDPPILQEYELSGEMLWEINLGHNIREGAHYTQFMVYDLDADGHAEIVCKTADGTRDGRGTIIGDARADWRNEDGRVLAGPEYLTVFDGRTGVALSTTAYRPPRRPDTVTPTRQQLNEIWGDGYGNRCDRFLACIAYLDGKNPSVVMCRGYYTRSVLVAWDFRGGTLSHRWTFDSAAGNPRNRRYGGQGNHSVSVADVDGDGRDEIIYGGMAINDDGTGLYCTQLGHGDAMHVSDLDPARPGLEVFRIQERFDDAGVHMFDAATGRILWKHPSVAAGPDGEGPGRGLALDIDPRFPGHECWALGAGLTCLFTAKGERIPRADGKPGCADVPSVNMGVWWDGDLLRELLDDTRIEKWDYETQRRKRLMDAGRLGCVSNNGTKGTPVLVADILGDWREEVIWRSSDNQSLRIFVSTLPTQHRLVTLMHDPQYRVSVAWQNVGYNQPPHPGYFLGWDMKPAPRASIVTP